jgi:uncharacterized protein YgiM (DUF1202 family)
MKMKHGLIWVLALFTGLTTVLADSNTAPALPVPGAAPAPAPAPADTTTPAPVSVPVDTSATTNKPAAKKTAKKKDTAKKMAKKEKAAEPAAPPLLINEPAASKQNNVNVRAQAHINSEIITHLKRDEVVTVLEDVTLKHPKIDEPAKWARIALPAGTHVWINSAYIDATNQTVKPAKLNIRSGAGENYSVIGTMKKGDAVKAVNTKGEWTEIEAPTNAFGFVAAHLLMHKTPTEPVTPAPVPTTETVAQNNVPIAPPPTGAPGVTPAPVTPTPAPAPVEPVVNPVIPAPLPAPSDEPPPKRVVQREGIVGGTVSIQAPSHYQLESLDDGRVMDYLYTTSTNVVLKKYKGRTVLVSGEEELDERWPNTPVITIQKIQVVE